MVVQIVSSAWSDVNGCAVLIRTPAKGLVILGRILDSPALKVLSEFKYLRALLGQEFVANEAFIFSTLTNELRIPSDVTARWSILVAKARTNISDFPLITPKGVRHTHATLLLQSGVNPKIVQERLGHSDISTTLNIYTHLTPTIQT